MAFNYSHFEHSSVKALFNIFLYAIKLDLSAASYLLIIPFLLLLINLFFTKNIFNVINAGYQKVVIFILNVVCVSNIVLYKYWHALISKRALDFLNDPVEIFASLTTVQFIALIALYAILFYGFNLLRKKIVAKELPADTSVFYKKAIAIVISIFMIFYCLRGGLQLIPINESVCYFSDRIEENHAAINPPWYLARNVQLAGRAGEHVFKFYDEAVAQKEFEKLMQSQPDTCIRWVKTNKPNIVILLLESHTADVIGRLGGDSDNSPCLDKMIKEDAFTFTQCYASGFRTDQMMPSVFSGFPAQPNNSIIRHDDKIEKLPHLPLLFKQAGYHTSFYYAGEMGFANMKSYAIHAGFEKLIDKTDYNSNQLNSKWGAHDEYAFNKLLSDLNKSEQPFFTSMLTISLHEPFEIPANHKYPGNTESIKFKNAAYYTDSCIGAFFIEAKKQQWYANTLFILMADHGHHLPRERDYYDPYTHRIPLIIIGGALDSTYHGKLANRITNQNDLPAILLNQLNWNATAFTFSKNTLNQSANSFAYLCYDDGFSWVADSCSVNYSLSQNKMQSVSICNSDKQKAKNTLNGKAFLQVLYKKFLDL